PTRSLSSLSPVPPPTAIYTLSLHDALPIYADVDSAQPQPAQGRPLRRLGPLAGVEVDEAVQVLAGENPARHPEERFQALQGKGQDRKSTRLNSSHVKISYAVFCLKKKKKQ